jgi:hypothetical protein
MKFWWGNILVENHLEYKIKKIMFYCIEGRLKMHRFVHWRVLGLAAPAFEFCVSPKAMFVCNNSITVYRLQLYPVFEPEAQTISYVYILFYAFFFARNA